MKTITSFILMTLMAIPAVKAQTSDNDSTTVRIGYSKGSQNTVAGAIDQLTEKRMNKGLITSSLDYLSGQAAGVQVASSGNQEVMVSAVRVRGTTSLTGKNDPLVIIDGVTADLAILSIIYPADIESFTILKDASETAQYGSRGAAGVIEVATKRGKEQKFHISYDGISALNRFINAWRCLMPMNSDRQPTGWGSATSTWDTIRISIKPLNGQALCRTTTLPLVVVLRLLITVHQWV